MLAKSTGDTVVFQYRYYIYWNTDPANEKTTYVTIYCRYCKIVAHQENYYVYNILSVYVLIKKATARPEDFIEFLYCKHLDIFHLYYILTADIDKYYNI